LAPDVRVAQDKATARFGQLFAVNCGMLQTSLGLLRSEEQYTKIGMGPKEVELPAQFQMTFFKVEFAS
jgi:hypothetical protein